MQLLPLDHVLELRAAGNWDAVERICHMELSRLPGDPELSWQLACAQWRRHDPSAAEQTMRRADKLRPGNPAVLSAIAQFVAEQARYGAAHRLYEQALALDPKAATPSVDLAELDLRKGDWLRGWSRYEARLTRQDRAKNSIVSIMSRFAPHWTGQSLENRILLVYSEQGSGDDIQMVRFVRELAERVRKQGGKLVLAVRRALHLLMRRHYVPCVEIETIAEAQDITADYCLPMMSIPFLIRLKPDQINGKPYLTVDAEKAAVWRMRLENRVAATQALQIGLVWRGNPLHRRDAQRSMSLRELEPLFDLPDIVFHPLSPDGSPLPSNAVHCDFTNEYENGFEDVAAHMSRLDAVVTIDSAPLHLGGALGVPVFAMIDRVSQWAWGKAETQRWYESVILFRQPEPGNWNPVVSRVAARLRDLSNFKKNNSHFHANQHG